MLTLRKRFSNPSDIYEGLKVVLGCNDIIITSMEQYLMSINQTISSLNGNDIVLCEHNTNQTNGVLDFNTHKYNGTFTSRSDQVKPITDIAIGNDINTSSIGEIRDVESFKEAYTNYLSSNKLPDECCYSNIAINYINTKYNFNSYDSFVDWAIYTIQMHRPSPFNLEYPNSMYTLHLNKDNFAITFPNGIGFGILVAVREGQIFYDVDIIYNGTFANQTLFKQTDVYKNAINNKWECK